MSLIAGSVTVDRNRECIADRTHAFVTQPSEPADEDADGHALDRVEVDGAVLWHRVVVGLEHDLARQAPDRGRTGGDERPTESRDGGVAGQHDDRTSADLRQLAPPELATAWLVDHDEDAAGRNDARSPHSSASSIGWTSYAA